MCRLGSAHGELPLCVEWAPPRAAAASTWAVSVSGDLDGRTAVVTGTANGIGAAVAEALRQEGAGVHRVDKDLADLAEPAAVRRYFDALDRVDVLVNGAGGVCGQSGRPIEAITDLEWDSVFAANMTTTFLCTRAVVPGMKSRGWGRIVNISSGAGRSVSMTGIQAYASAKAAQIGFTRQMAVELGPFGITVNSVAPGFILSNPTTIKQWESFGEEGQRSLVDGIATRRLGRAEDIANGVRFFAAEASSWVTGQTLSIDGGHGFY